MSLDPTKIPDDDDDAPVVVPAPSPPPPQPDPVRIPPAARSTGEPMFRIVTPCSGGAPGQVVPFAAFTPNAPFASDGLESAASKRRKATEAVVARLTELGSIEPAEGSP